MIKLNPWSAAVFFFFLSHSSLSLHHAECMH
jgi:hypothetical protein